MGTRADFYIGIDKNAEWLGSIAWDGYPEGIDDAIFEAPDAETFRHQVATFFATREDATRPTDGWPWPWNDSGLTDYSYWFANGIVYVAGYGKFMVPLAAYNAPANEDVDDWSKVAGAVPFDPPDMSAVKNFTLGKRSGVITISG